MQKSSLQQEKIIKLSSSNTNCRSLSHPN